MPCGESQPRHTLIAGDSAVRLPLNVPMRDERSGAVYVITQDLTYRPRNSSSKRNSRSQDSSRSSRRSHSRRVKLPCRSADLLTGMLGCMAVMLCYKIIKLVAVVGRWRELSGRGQEEPENVVCPRFPLVCPLFRYSTNSAKLSVYR